MRLFFNLTIDSNETDFLFQHEKSVLVVYARAEIHGRRLLVCAAEGDFPDSDFAYNAQKGC
ncbi:MAG: hypothetical protein VB876_08320 [Pirellulales bacterium]